MLKFVTTGSGAICRSSNSTQPLFFIGWHVKNYFRAERKAAAHENDRQPIMDEGDTDSTASSPYVKRISGPVFLTYHDNTSTPVSSRT